VIILDHGSCLILINLYMVFWSFEFIALQSVYFWIANSPSASFVGKKVTVSSEQRCAPALTHARCCSDFIHDMESQFISSVRFQKRKQALFRCANKEDTGILVCILRKEKWNLGHHGGTSNPLCYCSAARTSVLHLGTRTRGTCRGVVSPGASPMSRSAGRMPSGSSHSK